MRVCFLLGGFFSNGGIGRVTSILCNNLAKDGDIELYTLSYANMHMPSLYKLDERIQSDFLFDQRFSMKQAFIKGAIGKVRRYLTDNKIDILIACGSLYFPLAIFSCVGKKTKCICWDHTAPNIVSDHQFQKISRNIGAKYSDYNVVLTKAAKKEYDRKYHRVKETTVIYNPIDSEALQYRKKYKSESKRILSVGRLTYQKNYEDLVIIAKQILEKYPDWSWDIYGDGDLKEKIESLICKENLADKLILKGKVNDMYKRYNEYSFFVMTSRYEGFPMTLLESAANGLPMVSFDIETGPNEIICESNGFLIPWNDEKNAKMIQSIMSLIDNKNLREICSEGSIKVSKQFTLESSISDWKRLFSKLYC